MRKIIRPDNTTTVGIKTMQNGREGIDWPFIDRKGACSNRSMSAPIMGVESGGDGGRFPTSREFWGMSPGFFSFLHFLFKSQEK